MALIKTTDEIQKMREGGVLLSKALQAAIDAVRPGITLRELDKISEDVIRSGGGTPSFLGYKNNPSDTPFPSTVCISVNDEVVHGSGVRKIELKEGDLVGLDIGCWYKDLCTDMAATVPVGGVHATDDNARNLLEVTRGSLMRGIEEAKVGNTVKDISAAIEGFIKPHGYGIVRSLVGHGVGHKVHEKPRIPNFVSDRFQDEKLVDGMCLAIEPMLTTGAWQVDTGKDGWSVQTADGSLGSHFELTIAITKDGTEILTPPPNVGF